MIWLSVYFYISIKDKLKTFSKTIFGAFAFSWLGDVTLLFQQKDELYFMLGLTAFLIAHIFFIVAFRMHGSSKRKTSILRQDPFISVPFLLIGAGAYYLFSSKLGDMAIPVLVYTIAIIAMVITALNRNNKTNQKSFRLIFRGAILFMISDMAIAIDKFYQEIPLEGVIIMSTYIAAQYLIMRGSIEHLKHGANQSAQHYV